MNQEINFPFSIMPVLFSIGNYNIRSHDFFAFLALLFGGLIYFYFSHYFNQKNEKNFIIIITALFGWAIGSRLPIIIANFSEIWHNTSHIYALIDGKTIVWGLIGGTISVWIVKKRMGIKKRMGNIIAPAVALWIAIGRIGCFLWSDAVGIPTELPWGVDFWDHILRHPTQLYESIFCILIFIYIVYRLLGKNKPKDGEMFTFFIVSYFIFRFLVEFIRIEPRIYWWLTAYQYAAILVLLYQGIRISQGNRISLSSSW